MIGTLRSMEFHEWVIMGMEKGWIGPQLCATHDGLPLSEAQEADFDEGFDPCVPIFRIYESEEERDAVEYNHSPSQWRKY